MRKPPWMTVKSAGLNQVHREWLKDLAAEIAAVFSDPVMVNIGIYYGASMHCMRAGAPRATLVGVDIQDWGIKHRKQLHAEYIWEDSGVCHVGFARPVHLLFVDGASRYEFMKRDIEGWCPKVARFGIAAFNVYHLPPPRWGAKPALDEWLEGQEDEWEDVDAPSPIRAIRRAV